jgi:hypothetical protein
MAKTSFRANLQIKIKFRAKLEKTGPSRKGFLRWKDWVQFRKSSGFLYQKRTVKAEGLDLIHRI